MDVAALVREEWSTLLLIVSGAAGAVVAAGNGDWVWGVTCAALVIVCLRLLQAQGWIPQEGFI